MGSLRSLHKTRQTEAERQFRKFLIEMAEYGILSPEAQEYWGVSRNRNAEDDEK